MKTLLDIGFNKKHRDYSLFLKQKIMHISKKTFCMFASKGGTFHRITILSVSISFDSSRVCGITWHFDAVLHKDRRSLIF